MMFIKTDGMAANGTSLSNYIDCSFMDLVSVFGEPTYEDPSADDKVNVEWVLRGENGDVATIYNWKDGRIPTEDYRWHVGGTSYNATEVVDMIVDNFNRNGDNDNGGRQYVN